MTRMEKNVWRKRTEKDAEVGMEKGPTVKVRINIRGKVKVKSNLKLIEKQFLRRFADTFEKA